MIDADRPPLTPGKELLFLPLGGAGEIGMNLYLYGADGCWLLVDLGIYFPGERHPGIEIMTPDPDFLIAIRKQICGLVLTHAHEDHIGAVPYLWETIRCPIWASPFTASVLSFKLSNVSPPPRPPLNIVNANQRCTIGPFSLHWLPVAHSIPEASALVVRTPYGAVLHTGDWNFDETSISGPPVSESTLKALGDEGVLAMVGDSTNVFRRQREGSERELRASLASLISQRRSGRVAVTCFASNVARLESIAHAASVNGRHVVLVGRSMWRYQRSAREVGYLGGAPPFLDERDAADLPAEKVLYLCTGSQGEERAALARIAFGHHPRVRLENGDSVIFSSRVIPGNEKAIYELYNAFIARGVHVITERQAQVHVSGHPAREELEKIYQLVRPRYAIPMHGELRHLQEHAELARSMGVEGSLRIVNGEVLRLAPGAPSIIGRVRSGRLALYGSRLLPLDHALLRARRAGAKAGVASVIMVAGADGALAADPVLSAPTVLGDDEALAGYVCQSAQRAWRRMAAAGDDDRLLSGAVQRAVRQAFFERAGLKPLTDVRIVRLP